MVAFGSPLSWKPLVTLGWLQLYGCWAIWEFRHCIAGQGFEQSLAIGAEGVAQT
jgi:hypothetical protein